MLWKRPAERPLMSDCEDCGQGWAPLEFRPATERGGPGRNVAGKPNVSEFLTTLLGRPAARMSNSSSQ